MWGISGSVANSSGGAPHVFAKRERQAKPNKGREIHQFQWRFLVVEEQDRRSFVPVLHAIMLKPLPIMAGYACRLVAHY
jgi:hypothetical protein